MAVIGGEGGQAGVRRYHRTEVVNVGEFVQRHQLNADIAKRGSLYRARHHGDAAGIRAKLVQQLVLAAAAHDVQLAERLTAQIG